MKRLALGFLIAGSLLLVGAPVFADPPTGGPPGQGQCDHGNSDNDECRPDPQPDHGQDCEEHGPNEGGVNEDHCEEVTPSETPSPTPSETPSPTPSETPSPTPSETPSPSATPSPSESPTPSVDPSPTQSPTPSESPSPTVSPPAETPSPPGNGSGSGKPPAETPTGGRLAFTGIEDVLPIGGLALMLLGAGLLMLAAGRKRQRSAA